MITPLLRFVGHQRWLRVGVRNRLIRNFVNHRHSSSFEFDCDFFGLRYSGDLSSYIDWQVYFFGAYERELLCFLDDYLAPFHEPIVLDIGANVGNHALFLSRICGELHAFEPNSEVRFRLEQRVADNQIENIRVHAVGLGAEDARLPYHSPTGSNRGTGSFVSGYSANNDTGSLRLPVRQGDKYLSSLDLSRIDLVKLDVEGFEKDVLVGMRHTLRRFRPAILMEFSTTTADSFQDSEELCSLLPENYRISSIACNRPMGWLFNDSRCRLDAFDFDTAWGSLWLSPQ
jgi:FkbM family methyltransferase